MTGTEFHDRLDAFYAAGDAPGAYAFLRRARDDALAGDDRAMLLTADNALIGHCRENVIFDEVEGYYREALDCIERMDLHGSQAEATTFLNTATAFCIMGRAAESEALYDRAEALYRRLLPPNDPYMAAMSNNRGLLLRALGKRAEAFGAFRKSLAVLSQCEDVDAERAATLLNLASVCPEKPQAEQYLAEAMRYYETPEGARDIHRFTAMATKAELSYRAGDYAAAGAGFEATAAAWAAAGGAPERRKVLLRNALVSYENAGDGAAAARLRAEAEG